MRPETLQRAEAARALRATGMKRSEVGEALGLSKNQVDRYLREAHATHGPDQYVVDPETGCWNWQRFISPDGYPFCAKGLAHRCIYGQRVGSIPEGMQLHHECENRSCVNPAHLHVTTPTEHLREHMRRRSPLTWDDVHVIRERHTAGETHQQIAGDFDVTPAAIYRIVRHERWAA